MYRSKDGAADVDFLTYYFKTPHGKRLLELASPGGAGRNKTLGQKEFGNIKLLLPPGREQQKIARILSTWDKAVATVEKLIENSKAQKKAMMQQLLTGKRRLPGFTKDWKLSRLGDHCIFKGGVAFKEIYQGLTSGDFPFIKVSDMSLSRNNKFILDANNWVTNDLLAKIKARPFSAGSVVFAKVGAALLLNRRRILARETIIDNNMMAAIPKPSIDSEFLYQTMLRINFARFVQDGAVPSVNQKDLSSIKFHLPELAEQKEIVKCLAAAEYQMETWTNQLRCLKEQKKALMQQLLTGKRRVKVDDS